jgi:pyruvate kinase
MKISGESMRRTKIVCTLGPTSEEKEVIVNLVLQG